VRVRDPGGQDAPPPPRPAEVTFRVPTPVITAKLGLATVILAATGLAGDRLAAVTGLAAGAALAIFGVRDVLARDRLRADATGVDVVRGYSGRRHLDWEAIESLRVDERLRFGVRSQLLEVDADAELYLFSRYDLGVEPAQALAAITAVRR
jgi:hypothetical protein